MADYERHEIDGFVFEIGHISPKKALILMPTLARTGQSSAAMQEAIDTLLTNTFLIDGEKRFKLLAVAESRLSQAPHVLFKVFQAAQDMIYRGFPRGNSEGSSDPAAMLSPLTSSE